MKAVLLAMLVCAPAALAEPMRATLVEGDVSVSRRGGEIIEPIAAGASLEEGDAVQTGATGRLEIEVAGGTIIRLGENTRLKLAVAQPGAFNARLLLGNLWTRVRKLVSGESFAVETENGVAGVRGTEFRIEARGGQPDLLRVYEGAVQVGDERVEPGQELRYRRGAQAQRASFDPQSEKGHRFMEWVKARDPRDGRGEPGSIRRPDRENRLRERRERRRER